MIFTYIQYVTHERMNISEDIQEILDEATRLHHKVEVIAQIKSGKEAVVYKVHLNNALVAMKVYKKTEQRTFKNTSSYLIGKSYKKSSERKAVAKGNKFAKKLQYQNWVRREYFMLEKLYALGAKVPKPILNIQNALFMELIGNEDVIAPRLCDSDLTKKEAEYAYKKIIETILICWNFGIVHADLSEYNILWWNNTPYLIDFPQAIDKRNHPNAEDFLERDLTTITNFFRTSVSIDLDSVKRIFLHSSPNK